MKLETPDVTGHKVNPGDTLRNARESRGLSAATVAAQLSLPLSKIQLIDAGEFDKLPGHTFARGYVRSYARILGLDPERLVLEFDQFTGTNAAGADVHALGRVDTPGRRYSFLRLLSLLIVLAVAGIGFYWWQERASALPVTVIDAQALIEVEGADGELQYHPVVELEDAAVVAASDAQAEVPLDLLVTEETAEQVAQVAATETSASPVVATTAVEPIAEVAATEQTPAAAPNSAAVPAGQGRVEVEFSDTCWVQVTDASGAVLVSGLKRKGETVNVQGKAPLELRLGLAKAASARYNGEVVDLAPFTSNETVRASLGR